MCNNIKAIFYETHKKTQCLPLAQLARALDF